MQITIDILLNNNIIYEIRNVKMRSKYKLFDHTADLGVEIWGKDIKELYENAAIFLSDTMVGINNITSKEKKRIIVKSFSKEELFLDWMRELIYIFTIKEFLFNKVEIIEFKEKELKSILYGEKRRKHKFKKEIKTPTYHQFKIEKDKNYLKVRIIFDV